MYNEDDDEKNYNPVHLQSSTTTVQSTVQVASKPPPLYNSIHNLTSFTMYTIHGHSSDQNSPHVGRALLSSEHSGLA